MTDAAPNAPEIIHRPATKARQAALVLRFPDGVELTRYENGTYKLGAWDHYVVIEDMRNHAPGASRGSGYVKAYFAAIED